LIQKSNKQIEMMKKLEGEKKLTYKHSIINEHKRNEIVPWKSKHFLSLQRSKYLVIENDIE
jgi:hypothetical protein